MSFDAWVVGFGLSRVLIELKLLASPWAYSVLALAIVVDSYLLYVFFTTRRPAALPSDENGGGTIPPATIGGDKPSTMPVSGP
jgi:hypothetical protein